MTTGEMAFAAVGAAGTVLGGVAWLVTLHNRVANAHRDAKEVGLHLQAHETICSERYKHIADHQNENRTRMERIEEKLDDLRERTPPRPPGDRRQS